MRHLGGFAVALDAARDVAYLALRQLPLDEAALGMEEHEIDAAGIVLARDLVGRLGVAARRRAVFEHAHGQRRDRTRHRTRNRRFGAAIDDARR